MFADLSARLPPGLTAAAVAAGDAGVLAAGEPTRLLRWKAGRLAEVPLPPISHPRVFGIAAADFDGDGRDEWYLAGSPDRLLRLTPSGWQSATARPGKAVQALDRRGTGRYSFAVAGGPLRLFESADGTLHDAAPALGLNAPAVGVWAGPLRTERPDLMVLGDGPNHLFLNQCDGEFASADGLADPAECGLAATVVDVEGKLAVCVVNRDGPNRLFLRQVDGTHRDRATPALALPGAAVGVVAADFDNCGRQELLVFCAGEPNRLFRQSPDGWRLTDAGPAVGGPGCVVDMDNDGTLELLLAGHPARLVAAPNANGWLRVKPLTRFGAAARGATVRLTAGGRTQVRVIDGGPHEAVAHFGLGDVDRVDSLAVTWPDGARASVDAPAVRQTLTLRHPDTGAVC